MVEKFRIGQLQGTAGGAALGVGGAVDDAPDPGVTDGAHAHDAGFQGHVQRGVDQPVIFQHGARRPQRNDFGMCRGVMRRDGPVPPLGHDVVAEQQHGAHRHLARLLGPLGQFQRMAHPVLIPCRRLHVAAGSVSPKGRGRFAGHFVDHAAGDEVKQAAGQASLLPERGHGGTRQGFEACVHAVGSLGGG